MKFTIQKILCVTQNENLKSSRGISHAYEKYFYKTVFVKKIQRNSKSETTTTSTTHRRLQHQKIHKHVADRQLLRSIN